MRRRMLQFALLVAGGVVAVIATAAALEWWLVALTGLAAVQVAAVIVLVDIRGRMARSSELRRIAKSLESAQRRVDNLGTRMLSVAETSRLEVADHVAGIGRALDRIQAEVPRKELENLAAGVDAMRADVEQLRSDSDDRRSEIADWRRELDALRARLTVTGEDVARALDDVEKERHRQERRQSMALSRHIRQTEALIQLYDRLRPRASMPSSGGWALDPTGILTLLELVERRRPALVLELGSGTSTLWLAYRLKELGAGRIVTIDHEEQYAEATREQLRAHGLDELVEVRVAPLVEAGLPGHSTLWYDHSIMADLTGVDLLVVDGPPQGTGPLARYPAMAKLAGQLAESAVVALDDAMRPDEREVLQRWCAENPGLREWPVPPGDGLKVLVRDPAGHERAG